MNFKPDPKPEPRKKKTKKAIRQVSVKRQGLNKQYRIVRDQYLLENFKCEKCLYAASTEVHHKKGRTGDLLADVAYFMAVCRDCHQFIELNPVTALKMGWSFKRLDK